MKTALVIGGGVAGCSTAHSLAKRGIQVTLIERHSSFAAEASGNPLAMLYPRLSGEDSLSQFALAGFLYTLQWLRDLNLDKTQFDACGLLQLGFNAREQKRIEKVALTNHAAFKLVSAQLASQLAGITLAHDALYFPDAGWLKPAAICERLIQHSNISTVTLHSAINILNENNLIKIICNDNTVLKADIVVICNANDAHTFNQSAHIKTTAVRGQITQLSATEYSKQLKTVVCSDGYLSPEVESEHSLGATFSTESQDLAVSNADHLANLNTLKTISMPLYLSLNDKIRLNKNMIAGRVAYRCTTPDYFPLVGQLLNTKALLKTPPRPNAPLASLPWHAGLYTNVAHGSRGFTSAPLCAELLACLICSEPLPLCNELAGLLNPNRFLLREMGLKKLSKQTASR